MLLLSLTALSLGFSFHRNVNGTADDTFQPSSCGAIGRRLEGNWKGIPLSGFFGINCTMPFHAVPVLIQFGMIGFETWRAVLAPSQLLVLP